MNILKNAEQAVVRVNQPTNWPRLYLIPEPQILPRCIPASNDPAHQQSLTTAWKHQQESRLQRFIRIEKEILQETCADAWAALKQAGKEAARWVARWVLLPLSIVCTFWIDVAGPAELQL